MPLRAATVDIESVVLSWARHTPCTLHAQWRQTWPAFNLPRQARCWPLNNTFLCMRIIIIDENEGLWRYRFRFGQMMSSISRVHRPRGSEAYMVIIVPFNTMAKYSVCWDYEHFFFSVCLYALQTKSIENEELGSSAGDPSTKRLSCVMSTCITLFIAGVHAGIFIHHAFARHWRTRRESANWGPIQSNRERKMKKKKNSCERMTKRQKTNKKRRKIMQAKQLGWTLPKSKCDLIWT